MVGELSSLLTMINFGEPKPILYALHVYEMFDRLWATCERSSPPSIITIEDWKISMTLNHMPNFQECKLVWTG